MRRGRLADVDNPDVPGDKTRLLFYAVYKILQKLLLECFEHPFYFDIIFIKN